MRQDIQDGMNLVATNVDSMQMFVIINNFGIMKNVDVNLVNVVKILMRVK